MKGSAYFPLEILVDTARGQNEALVNDVFLKNAGIDGVPQSNLEYLFSIALLLG